MRQRPDFEESTASIKLIAYLASIHSSKLRLTLTSSTENLARVRLRLLMPGMTQMRQHEAFVAIDIHRPAEVTVVELSVLLPTVVIGRQVQSRVFNRPLAHRAKIDLVRSRLTSSQSQ